MRISKLFTKTIREVPSDEKSINAKLLIQGGFIYKEMAGVYNYLPLGFRALKKIENIIREEMNNIGGQEILMTTLQSSEVWKKSGRWDDSVVDNWFKTKLVSGQEIGIANTHEEPLTEMLTHYLNSYKDFPVYIYQFQNKFRNELRAKSGIMRGREFLMKDLYSFSKTEDEFKEFYEKCAMAYERIFERVGIGDKTYRTIAAGGSFTKDFTNEFQTISASGEDIIYVDEEKKLAINEEIYNDENLNKFGFKKDKLKKEKSIEVGHIFSLGDKYSSAAGLFYKDQSGNQKPVIMGCYGIGLGRLLGAIVEVKADDKGLIWPKSVSPYDAHLINLDDNKKESEQIYQELQKNNIEVLWDDREESAGVKFKDADLIGLPVRLIVSKKTLKEKSAEIKLRSFKSTKLIKINNLVSSINKLLKD